MLAAILAITVIALLFGMLLGYASIRFNCRPEVVLVEM